MIGSLVSIRLITRPIILRRMRSLGLLKKARSIGSLKRLEKNWMAETIGFIGKTGGKGRG
jgi:hypothetical protein